MQALSEYLEGNAITQKAFAQTIGISKSFLNDIVKRRRTPGLDVALRIRDATGGNVSLDTLLANPCGPDGSAAASIQGEAAE